jgi:hypothetical protein
MTIKSKIIIKRAANKSINFMSKKLYNYSAINTLIYNFTMTYIEISIKSYSKNKINFEKSIISSKEYQIGLHSQISYVLNAFHSKKKTRKLQIFLFINGLINTKCISLILDPIKWEMKFLRIMINQKKIKIVQSLNIAVHQ